MIVLFTCNWLPDLLKYDNIYPNLEVYDDAVYTIFKHDFIDTTPTIFGLNIGIRKNPPVNGREQTYYHITSKDYNHSKNRTLDLLRCERIRWVRQIIEHFNCHDKLCFDCDGIKTWSALHSKNQKRIKILFAEERYIVILEKRSTYYLLITAYYLEYNHVIRKLLKEFEKAKSASEETQSGTPSTLK